MNAQLSTLKTILAKHRIHTKFHEEFRELVEHGVTPSRELKLRLDNVDNYKAALDEAMTALSQSLPHKFPPVRFQSLKEYA